MSKPACCGRNAPRWKLHGGRFGEAGDRLACDECLPDMIEWIMKHPIFKDKPEPMVEVRIFTEQDRELMENNG